ncbi:regulatory particle non-ATPase 13 isoform X2 [Oratosquilla oratoria]|uniref:regulatory particle non-ATPase 13 isoform X2 n=1 Tax=Oratosquilla oratoria TaxID=337810 RepID=UPI003F765BD7
MSGALFGGTTRSSSKNLVEFRAGKMYLKGKMVHPDKRKGQVYLYQADDSLMHFCWKDRTTGTVEEDLIIFPDDCEYVKITQCSTGRVYLLKFKSINRKLFFWMQEPKVEKDDELARKVNELLNNPPTPGSQRSSGSTPNPMLGSDLSTLSNIRDSDIQNLFGNMSQHQLVQLLGGGMSSLATLLGPGSGNRSGRAAESSSSGPRRTNQSNTSAGSGSSSGSRNSSLSSATNTATTTPSATTPASTTPAGTGPTTTPSPSPAQGTNRNESSEDAAGPIQLSDLQNILSGISVPPDASATPRTPVDLSSGMTAEALQPILTNAEFVEQLKPYLPTTGDNLPPVEQLRGTITSPQFQQAVSLFSSALQSGQLGPLINQFGLGEEAVLAASSCDMEAFIKALAKKDKGKDNEGKKEESKEGKDQDKEEDDSMAVD